MIIQAGAQAPMLFAIGTSADLGARIASRLNLSLAPLEERAFEDGEQKIRPLVSVRDRDVYVVYSLHGDEDQSANDKLCRLLFFVGSLKDAGAGRVTAVVPYLCYARKDRQTRSRDPITSRYIAQLLEAMGCVRVATMEVHNLAAFQNGFRCKTDHLAANGVFIRHLKPLLGDAAAAVVSPDPGGVKRADQFRKVLEEALGRAVGGGFVEKYRSMGELSGGRFVGDVAGHNVIVVDDMISTGGTVARAAAACRANGASSIYLVATHGLFNPGAEQAFADIDVAGIVVSDTVPLRASLPDALRRRITVVDTAPVFAELIGRHRT